MTQSDYGVVGAEQDAVTQLMTLLVNLERQTQEQLQALREEEAGRVEKVGTLMNTLNGVIGKLVTEGEEIEADKATLERCLINEAAIMEASYNKLIRN